MKRRRNVTLIVCAILALIVGGAVFIPAAMQNLLVCSQFANLFTAIKQKDTRMIDAFYRPNVVMAELMNAMLEYDLLGWKITGVTGQPYPMDCMNDKHYVYAKMYFQLPDKTDKQKSAVISKYQVINHRRYGRCFVVPVKLEFEFNIDRYASKMGWSVTGPSPTSAENWPTPFIKKRELK